MKEYELYPGEANTLVCRCFSDCYAPLNSYILSNGIKTFSRLGPTFETLNFKTVIKAPLMKCTIALNRNSNIFFHLAESLWVLGGRNDLEFIQMFNSRFKEFSDDGNTLNGAYGKRMRSWNSNNGTEKVDQLFKITSLLNSDPDLRRSVISLWDPSIDLGNISKDIPCNTQLVLRVKDNDFYLTVFNRSNDLHWGYIANIFQFSFLGEIISLLINKRFVKQTHFSQSLHIYAENNLVREVAESNIHENFYSKYAPRNFNFHFDNSTNNFKDRFSELDGAVKIVNEVIITSFNSAPVTLEDLTKEIEPLQARSESIFEISFFLLLFVNYRKELNSNLDKMKLRIKYADYILERNITYKFKHQDYYALAMNYFVKRLDAESKIKYTTIDAHMGQY